MLHVRKQPESTFAACPILTLETPAFCPAGYLAALDSYVIAKLPSPATPSQIETNGLLSPAGGVGHVFRKDSKWWEVVASREARGYHPVLQSTFLNLQAMVELAQRMQDKLRCGAALRHGIHLAAPPTPPHHHLPCPFVAAVFFAG